MISPNCLAYLKRPNSIKELTMTNSKHIFFYLLYTLSISILSERALSQSICSFNIPQSQLTSIIVKQVYDGDTLVSKQGQKIRLIGINTPEMRHFKQTQSEPLAQQAKTYLQQWQNKKLLIQTEQQQTDHYGRTLAHLFTYDGKNISALLLQQGLGFLVSIPPNLSYQNCYLKQAQQAQAQHKGVYAHSYFSVQPANSPKLKAGFGRFSGKIEKVTKSKNSIWIDLKGNISIRISHTDLAYFNRAKLKRMILASKHKQLANLPRISISGWLIDRLKFGKKMQQKIRQKKRKRYQINLRHKNQWETGVRSFTQPHAPHDAGQESEVKD